MVAPQNRANQSANLTFRSILPKESLFALVAFLLAQLINFVRLIFLQYLAVQWMLFIAFEVFLLWAASDLNFYSKVTTRVRLLVKTNNLFFFNLNPNVASVPKVVA
jgi:hypothetical protein